MNVSIILAFVCTLFYYYYNFFYFSIIYVLLLHVSMSSCHFIFMFRVTAVENEHKSMLKLNKRYIY